VTRSSKGKKEKEIDRGNTPGLIRLRQGWEKEEKD